MNLTALYLAALLACPAFAQQTAEHNDAFRLVAKIPVPGMTGTWDHLAADSSTSRLFLSAQEDNEVRVIDLAGRKPLHTISGGFNRPQGEFFVPGANSLAVTNGRDGTLRSFDGKTYEPIKVLSLTLGADMMDYDPESKYLYIDHGGVDSNRGPGALAVVDTTDWHLVRDIATEYRPAALEIQPSTHRLFVTLPGLSQVGVIDTRTSTIIARFQAPRPTKPVAIALDTADKRVFVGTRSPDNFIAFDTETGKTVATLDSLSGIEGMYFDAAHKRIYVTGLDGNVQAIQTIDPDHYKELARFFTGPKAGTSIFIPKLNLFCVALPPADGKVAEVWLFEPLP
ncbi:YncE family protein [Edaphobacter bradus]|uniref:YncE family protein n=1 Tax=Edaphobacter bradus TaxID=2259016 RepID=UPI0021E05BDB|nr:YncE family protein [Edaphobacter bradus]